MNFEKLQIEGFIDKAKLYLKSTLSTYSGDKIESLDLGLSKLLDHFDKGLRGNLPDNYYLSSIDPGIGKTESYCSFIKSWKEMGFYPEGSIVVAVATLDEIPSIVLRCGLGKEDYACLTADPAINRLGRGEARMGGARVAFTTQAMIRSRTAGKLFADTKDFYYRSAPRPLRIWDEGFMLAQPVTLSLHDLTALSHSIRSTNPDLFAAIDALARQMVDRAADDCITIPHEIAALANGTKGKKVLPPACQETLSDLTPVANTVMVLRNAGGTLGRVLVGASAPLPRDFAPAIILDASGRVRGTYKAQEAGIGNLIRLKSSVRDYANVRVHVCKTKAGKYALADEDHRDRIYRASAKVINAKPHEQWLVISYKSNEKCNIEADLKRYVSTPGNISFLNWGRHHGTNEFRDCKNILIIGSNLYGPDGYHALEIAASGLSAGLFPGPSKSFAADELANNILQAVMRGNARQGTGSSAGDCEVYWLASKTPDPISAVKRALPNCDVREWNALDKPLRGLAKTVFDYVVSQLSHPGAQSVTKKSVRAATGIEDAPGLSRVVKDPLFIDQLTRFGVSVGRNRFTNAA